MGNIFGFKRRASVSPEASASHGSKSSDSSVTDLIVGGQFNYLKEEKLGEGSYGAVYGATQLQTNKKVALKLMREKHGKREKEAFLMLSGINPERKSLLPLLESFPVACSSKYCLVFPRLDADVTEFMARRSSRPLQVGQLRPVAQQLLVALEALRSLGVVHGDIKPNNVMFVDHETQPFRVLLIEFGLARRTSERTVHTERQVIGYRAPEVMLGLPGDEAVDMWALGCVLAHMFIGAGHLFPGHCPFEYLRAVCQMVGQPPDQVLEASPNTAQFFARNEEHVTSGSNYRLLTQEGFVEKNDKYTYRRPSVYSKCQTLDDLPSVHPRALSQAEEEDIREFMSLLKQMLCVDSTARIRPQRAVRHSFLAMGHLAPKRGDPYVTAALGNMGVCRSVTGKELWAKSSA